MCYYDSYYYYYIHNAIITNSLLYYIIDEKYVPNEKFLVGVIRTNRMTVMSTSTISAPYSCFAGKIL